MRRDRVNIVLDILEETYPEAECALDHKNVFELVVAVALSAQTTDVSVNKVTPKLFEKYPNAEDLAKANQEDVIDIIKTIGMYKTKSKNIINLAKKIMEDFEGQVPEDDEKLQSLPGVGRKTANVVMSVGFGHQRIAVDTHVFRVSNRIGIVEEKDPLKTELALMKRIDENRWSKTHHSLIFHGRQCCSAKNPKCDDCPINHMCKKIGVK
ncbi:MAG: endonuclease III [Eubacterium sp.]|nr:endonuclease III [Eubacterium sp.]